MSQERYIVVVVGDHKEVNKALKIWENELQIELKADFGADDYQEKAARTANMRSDKMNWLLGLAGEVGEVMEYIKKSKYHGKSFEIEHLKEELGDVLWYLAMVANSYNIMLSDIMKTNIEKLSRRHGDSFTTDY